MSLTYLRSQKGVMLFEVLLAVLILAIGITSSLQAFNSIVQVTSRSRDLFEAGFVLSELTFELFALPQKIPEIASGIEKDYSNTHLDTLRTYTYVGETVEVPLPESEEEAETTGVEQEEPFRFVRNSLSVSNEKGVLYAVDTFHTMKDEE